MRLQECSAPPPTAEGSACKDSNRRAQAAHHRMRLKDLAPGIAHRESPAQPAWPLFQDSELNGQPECGMCFQRPLHARPADFKFLQFILVAPFRCKTRQKDSLHISRNRRNGRGLPRDNQQEFPIGQNSCVAECGFRHIQIGRRKQHNRLRFRLPF